MNETGSQIPRSPFVLGIADRSPQAEIYRLPSYELRPPYLNLMIVALLLYP